MHKFEYKDGYYPFFLHRIKYGGNDYLRDFILDKSIKKNFCKKAIRLNKVHGITAKEYKQAIAPWLGWAKHSNSKHLLKTIIKKKYYESIL